MNSTERKQQRRLRREEARLEKRNKYMEPIDNIETVADLNHLLTAFKQSKRGVSWKGSIHAYDHKLLQNTIGLHKDIMIGKPVGEGFNEFTIMERGKKRDIKSISVRERVAQRSLCHYVLIPTLRRSLIYDNGASLKGKGVSFAINRLKSHMRDYYKHYGSNGYVLRIDFKSYFANIDHEKVKEIIKEKFNDERLKQFIINFVDEFDGSIGLGLGTETSQILAVAYPNKIDHYVKEVLRIKYYGRYMDDLYLIHSDKKYLQRCLEYLKTKINDLKIKLNTKKTFIMSLKDGIPFLKGLFFFGDKGEVVITPLRETIVTRRVKTKKMKNLYSKKKITLEDIKTSYISWRGCISHKKSRQSVYTMDKLVRREFGTLF